MGADAEYHGQTLGFSSGSLMERQEEEGKIANIGGIRGTMRTQSTESIDWHFWGLTEISDL